MTNTFKMADVLIIFYSPLQSVSLIKEFLYRRIYIRAKRRKQIRSLWLTFLNLCVYGTYDAFMKFNNLFSFLWTWTRSCVLQLHFHLRKMSNELRSHGPFLNITLMHYFILWYPKNVTKVGVMQLCELFISVRKSQMNFKIRYISWILNKRK